jgi:hypothetical protein
MTVDPRSSSRTSAKTHGPKTATVSLAVVSASAGDQFCNIECLGEGRRSRVRIDGACGPFCPQWSQCGMLHSTQHAAQEHRDRPAVGHAQFSADAR